MTMNREEAHVCENCDGSGEVVLKCCPEGDPCPYTGAIGVCNVCEGDGRCRCDDCAAISAKEPA